MSTLICAAMDIEMEGFEPAEDEVILITGIGKVNAAISLTMILTDNWIKSAMRGSQEPLITKVVNLGTAGGLGEPGTVHKINCFSDRCNAKALFQDDYEEIYQGGGDQLLATDDNFIKGEHMLPGALYDMEGYALAKVCDRFDVEFECFKVVTDAGGIDEWRTRIKQDMAKLFDYYRLQKKPKLDSHGVRT